MEKNYYQILGVQRNATAVEIKKRYRVLAGIHHPDKPSGNKVVFAQINIAFDTLKNTSKRDAYDTKLLYEERMEIERKAKEQEEKIAHTRNINLQDRQPHQSYQESYECRDITEKDDNYSLYSQDVDLKKPKPLIFLQEISVKESEKGCVKKIEYKRALACSTCNGAGFGHYNEETIECPSCSGTGQVFKKEYIKLEISPNTIVGRVLRLEKMGNEEFMDDGSNRVIVGDLIIQIVWKGKWRSKNKDLYTEVNIKDKDLENKFFYFKNFDGEKIKVFIPEGIKDGQTIKLNKKGWKHFNSNLYITITINKSLYQRFKDKFFN